jgi:hypothetical protein
MPLNITILDSWFSSFIFVCSYASGQSILLKKKLLNLHLVKISDDHNKRPIQLWKFNSQFKGPLNGF